MAEHIAATPQPGSPEFIEMQHLGADRTKEGERGSSMGLLKRTALITGVRYQPVTAENPQGLRNIGTALVERFALAGADLVIHGNEKREAELDALAKVAQSLGVRVEVATGDVSKPETALKLAGIVDQKYDGVLDILVNNAGVSPNIPFSNKSVKEWDRYLERWALAIGVNLTGTMLTTLAVVEKIKAAEKGHGRILNVSSIVGTDGHAKQSPYGASKGGINGFSLGLANELAGEQIGVMAVALGAVRSKIWRPVERYMASLQSPEDKGKVDPLTPIMRKTPLLGGERLMTLEEAAAPLAMLASDNGRTMTGQIYKVEAGILRLAME